MKKKQGIIQIVIILLIVVICIIVVNVPPFYDGKFDYCKNKAEAKNVFEQRIKEINNILKNESLGIFELENEEISNTGDHYFQDYYMTIDNYKITMSFIYDSRKLKYSFHWERIDENINLIYTNEEINNIVKILNLISKNKFETTEIYEFMNAPEEKYNPKNYDLQEISTAEIYKIKYINEFTRDTAFTHHVWQYIYEGKYTSCFSITGKFDKNIT